MGHRGAAGLAPENTLESIQKALDIGVDWVEFDVHCTADGRLVVIHDSHTVRIARGRARLVRRSTLETLQKLPTRSHLIIPTLAEVVQLISNRAKINMEIKSSGCAEQVASTIKKLVNAGYDYSHFLVSSFRIKILLEIQAINPRIPLSLLHYTVPIRFIAYKERGLKLKAVGFNQTFASARFVALARSMGLYVYIFTVNDPKKLSHYQEWGVNALVSDHPERFIERKATL